MIATGLLGAPSYNAVGADVGPRIDGVLRGFSGLREAEIMVSDAAGAVGPHRVSMNTRGGNRWHQHRQSR